MYTYGHTLSPHGAPPVCRFAEVVDQAGQQAVRADPAFHVRAVHGNGLHIVDVEEAILQAEVDVGRDRAANTSDRLPCELGVRIIDERRAVLGQLILGFLDASDTGATADIAVPAVIVAEVRSEEHTSELQSLMRISYAVFCLKKKNKNQY